MFASGLYMFNLVCAFIPCSATQPPPEAYIAGGTSNSNFTVSPIPIEYRSSGSGISPSQEERLDPVFLTENGYNDEENKLRRKRLEEDSTSVTTIDPLLASIRKNEYRGERNEFNLRNDKRNTPRTGRNLLGRQNNLLSNPLFSRNPLFSAIPAIPVLLGTFMRSMSSNNNNAASILSSVTSAIGGRPVRSNELSNQIPLNIRTDIEPPVVETKLGWLEGSYMGTMKGRRISAFEGIPYAEPPTGKYRFKVKYDEFY
jgi:hypothetical protein